MTIRFTRSPIGEYLGADQATWTMLSGELSDARVLAAAAGQVELFRAHVTLCLPLANFSAVVYSNRRDLLRLLESHVAMADSAPSGARGTETAAITLIYLVDYESEIDGLTLRASGKHYEGCFTKEKNLFCVSGSPTLGVFKSVLIGCWSSVFRDKGWYPAHCSVLVAPSGKSVAVFGRGNWGKTTTLLSCLDVLHAEGYSTLTDDWALIDDSFQIRCLDNVIALRPSIISSLPAIASSPWITDLFERFHKLADPTSTKPELPLITAFGQNVTDHARLVGCVCLSKEPPGIAPFLPINSSSASTTNETLARDCTAYAYHCPDASSQDRRVEVCAFYERLFRGCRTAVLNCRVSDPERARQRDRLIEWVREVVNDKPL